MVWDQVFMWKPRRNEMQSRLPYEALVRQTDEVAPVARLQCAKHPHKILLVFVLFESYALKV